MPRTLLDPRKPASTGVLGSPITCTCKKSGTNAAEINMGKWHMQPGNAAPVLPDFASALGALRGAILQMAMPKPWQDTGHVGASPQHNQATGFGQGPQRLGAGVGQASRSW